MLPFFCLLLAACSSLAPAGGALSVQNSQPFYLSARADRSGAEPLGGSTVSGAVYIFAAPPKTVKEVLFYLDEQPLRRVRRAPYDLLGGTRTQARALDTATLAEGEHTLRSTFRHRNGRRTQVQRTFTVENASADPGTPGQPTVQPPARWQPVPGTSWQWQLQGDLDLSLAVEVYDIDLFDTPAGTIVALQAEGKRVICYFSAGSFEPWRDDAASFPEAVKGKKLDGWDELWLDIRNLEALAPIMRARLELAAQKGCDGVEPDNVDAYSNDSGFPLSAADQLVYNRFLAAEAHAYGLAVGLKNDLDQVKALEPFFDFAVNEECFKYNECELLTPFVAAGKAVFGAEYAVSTRRFCPVTNALNLDFIKKRYSLDAYREACR